MKTEHNDGYFLPYGRLNFITTTQMFEKKILLLFMLLSSFVIESNAQAIPADRVSGNDVSILQDSATISLSKKISDRKFWMEILRFDTVFVSYMKSQCNCKDPDISVLDIVPSADKKTYEFRVYLNSKRKIYEAAVAARSDTMPILMIPRRKGYSVIITDAGKDAAKKIKSVQYEYTEL